MICVKNCAVFALGEGMEAQWDEGGERIQLHRGGGAVKLQPIRL